MVVQIVAFSNYGDGSIFKRSIVILKYAKNILLTGTIRKGSPIEDLQASLEANTSSKHFGAPNGLQFGKMPMNRCAHNVIWKAFVKRIVHNSANR